MSTKHSAECEQYLLAGEQIPAIAAMAAEFRNMSDAEIWAVYYDRLDEDHGTDLEPFLLGLFHLLTPETMSVTIRDRSAEPAWGSGPTRPVTRKVVISAYCPTCGGRRGKPRGLNQCEDGEHYWVQVWDNPCGHIDSYVSVVAEANRRAQAVTRAVKS